MPTMGEVKKQIIRGILKTKRNVAGEFAMYAVYSVGERLLRAPFVVMATDDNKRPNTEDMLAHNEENFAVNGMERERERE